MAKVFSFIEERITDADTDTDAEPEESITARRVLQQAVMSKYHVNVSKLHSSYEAFVVREVSNLQLGVLLVVATAAYAVVGGYNAQNKNAQAGIAATILSFLPVWILLICTIFKMGIPIKLIVWLGNATLLFHSISSSIILICISIDIMDFGTRTQNAGLHFASVVIIISLGALPCIVRCHTPIICALSWTVAELAMVLSAFFSGCSTDLTLYLPGLMVLVGFQMYSFERSTISAYNHLMGLEDAIRLSLDSENQQKVFEMQSAEMRHLIGNVAHDLKTPMQAFSLELNGLVSILSTYQDSVESSVVGVDGKATEVFIQDASQGIKTLKDTVHFMLMTINRAIDFSKASAGIKLSPSNSTVDVVSAIEWARHLVSDTQSRVPIIFRPMSDLICTHVITDNQWLIENLLCLVGNAVKFTEEGYVEVSCSLDMSKQRKPLLRFEVEDTGIGILPEVRAALFRPFSQAQRCAGGTGLGLYSLSKRMEALQGDCGLDDRHDGGQGCRFWFRIPYVPDIDAAENSGNPNRWTDAVKPSIRSGMFLRPSNGSRKNSSSVVPVSPPPGLKSPKYHMSPTPMFAKFKATSNPTSPRSQRNKVTSPGPIESSSSKSSEFVPIRFENSTYEQSHDNGIQEVKTDYFRSNCTGNDLLCSDIETVDGVERFEKSLPRVTVLLAEDSIVIQKSTVKALTRLNIWVDVAENGSIALKMLLKNSYDVVLMDLQMPVMDGFECVRRYRAHEKEMLGTEEGRPSPRLIIGISANSDRDTVACALDVGMSDFLAKPVSLDALKAMCSSHGLALF